MHNHHNDSRHDFGTTAQQHKAQRSVLMTPWPVRTHPCVLVATRRVVFGGSCGWVADKTSTTAHDKVRSQTRRPHHPGPQRMEHTLYAQL